MTVEAVGQTGAEDSVAGSYRSILKSTSLIGVASALNLVIGMVKTKIVAVLLGTAGIGLIGMYTQIVGLVSMISGFGLSTVGVRQVAESVGTGNDEQIAHTVITLRRTVWLTGGAGALVMVLACVPISFVSFKSTEHALPIALLGIAVLLSAITSGQACVLQGTRRIADLAKINVIGAATGAAVSIPCIYLWGNQGIVVSLILTALATLVTSWWFARRVSIRHRRLSWAASSSDARRMMRSGLSFMWAGLVCILSNYLIQALLLRRFDINAVGVYLAAFNLSVALVGFVLGAMGTDYYPRLTAVAGDDAKVRQMVNEQSEISILLAMPALVAMMVFAPLLIRAFYAQSFAVAIPILRWCLLGVLGRVFTWPLAFVMLAKGKGKLFLFTEFVSAAFHLSAIYCFTFFWGITGAGIAFMALYVFYTAMILAVIHRLIGATWSRHNVRLIMLASTVMAILVTNNSANPNAVAAWVVNLVALAATAYFCATRLSQRSEIGLNKMLRKIRGK